jgi:uncharacterized RDD family membrane protein YckC
MAANDSAKPQRATVPGSSVASRLAAGTGLERAVASVVEETIVRTVESDAVIQAIERIVEDGRLQAAIERSIDPEMIEEAVRKAIRSEVSDRVWEDILASDKAQMLVERVAEAPEVRAAIAQQGFGLITDIGRQVSRITEALDDGLERVAHAVVRRGDHEAETNQAGLATRAAAFAVDVALLFGFFSIVTGLFSSIIPTIFGDRSDGLSALAIALVSVVGFTFGAGIFVTFWTLIGQTPGMRFLGIRVQYHGSNEIPFRTAVWRVLAIPLALIPLGLGFLAILVSPKRRGWHDLIAGTEVIYDEASAPWSLKPREWVNPESGADGGRQESAPQGPS